MGWVEAGGWVVGEEEKAAVGWAAAGSGEPGSEAGSEEAGLEAEGSEAGAEVVVVVKAAAQVSWEAVAVPLSVSVVRALEEALVDLVVEVVAGLEAGEVLALAQAQAQAQVQAGAGTRRTVLSDYLRGRCSTGHIPAHAR